MVEFEEITKEDFIAYERVRMSGLTNMFDVSNVINLSEGELDKMMILAVMQNYSKLCEKWPDVRNQV